MKLCSHFWPPEFLRQWRNETGTGRDFLIGPMMGIAATHHLKIRSQRSLAIRLQAAREEGQRIVFTNGCFDLLHVGHVRYLQKARSLGDLLVVGLNSDASVRRLKGPRRPIVPLRERAEVLAALACVDFVVPFAEETPLRLIKALRPDVLVKGADWRKADIVGKGVVEGRGGRVARIRFVPGRSTTLLIERIVGYSQKNRDVIGKKKR